MRTGAFVKIGFASEKIEPGQEVEYLPLTGLVRRARPHKIVATVHPDGTMTEKIVADITGEQKEGD